MKTFLVTGPTGSIGKEVINELLSREENIRIKVLELRNNKTKKILGKYKNKIEIVWGSITDQETVDNAVKDVDFVIHLAAVIPPLADENQKLTDKVNVGGAENLTSALKDYAPNAFIIFTSSIAVYGDRLKDYWIKVGDPLISSKWDYYAQTKIIAEDIIKKSKLDYTIFRLTGVMGSPKIDPLLFHMPLDTRFEIATTRDVAFALVEATNHQIELNKNIYNLAGGKQSRVVYKDFLKENFSIYGLNFNDVPSSAFAKRNFHCGYYSDTDILNNILHFQRDDLKSYYDITRASTNKIKVFFTKVLSKIIVKLLVSKSEPFNAFKDGDELLIKRFYFSEKEDKKIISDTILKGKELLANIAKNYLKKNKK